MDAEYVTKVRNCASLLPPPGDEVVTTLAGELLTVLAERDALRAEVERLRAALEAARDPMHEDTTMAHLLRWYGTTRAEALRRE
jgi:hypothetical protein